MLVTAFSPEYLDSLTAQAEASPRARQHRNVHTDYADPCQRLFNAITRRSYLVPHRHGLTPRDETMLAVRGRLALVVFDDTGKVIEVVRFGSQGGAGHGGLAAGVLVPAGTWHTVLALDDDAILFETKAGPFDPTAPKEPAPWAPGEGSAGAESYFRRLREVVGG